MYTDYSIVATIPSRSVVLSVRHCASESDIVLQICMLLYDPMVKGLYIIMH